ncbi:hypothetical protein [Tepidibacter formicigenes]|uniref:Uncharacterized protein n=1 Tax=Tepidibacter formicigenes DSM 15518 TaxID=1123349 RepID=A0A1M6KF18_9FIRM|nr:hypothetical protein [Tepidibacter formicigenes]SHJ57510.1 hypothetical protein SAMN02744037_00353 [Tepidibacter formicigenes DSM 15518]
MYDRTLLKRIYNSLNEICKDNKITKVNKITFVTSMDSDLDEVNICDYFSKNNSELIGNWTDINIKRENFEQNIAIIHSIEGDNK